MKKNYTKKTSIFTVCSIALAPWQGGIIILKVAALRSYFWKLLACWD